MEDKKFKEGFMRGWRQLRVEDVAEARKKLYRAIGINNRASLGYYINGKTEPRASVAYNIEQVFEQFGIFDVWGK